MSERILITGGSGFIGNNLISYYHSKGFTCLNLDIHPPEEEDYLHIWKQVDLLNLLELEKTVLEFKPTYVLHMAARTDIFEKKDINGYAINYIGTENLLKVLKKCKSVIRVVFASSMLVCKTGYKPKSYNDYSPPNLYGQSKVVMEEIIKKANITEFEWVIIRPTSIWGPGFKAPYKDFFDLIKKGRYLKFKGKTPTKTFGYIKNTIHQINELLILPPSLVDKKVFYIGDYPPVNIDKWADLIAKHFKVKILIVPFFIIKIASWIGDILMFFNIPFPIYSFRVKNMTTNNVVSLLKDTHNIIPHQPYSLEEGVIETVKWMTKSSVRSA